MSKPTSVNDKWGAVQETKTERFAAYRGSLRTWVARPTNQTFARNIGILIAVGRSQYRPHCPRELIRLRRISLLDHGWLRAFLPRPRYPIPLCKLAPAAPTVLGKNNSNAASTDKRAMCQSLDCLLCPDREVGAEQITR